MLKSCTTLFMFAASVVLGTKAGELAWTKIEARYLK